MLTRPSSDTLPGSAQSRWHSASMRACAALHAVGHVVGEQDPVFAAGLGREERVEARDAADPREERRSSRAIIAMARGGTQAAVLLDLAQYLQQVVRVVVPACDAAPDARFVGLRILGHIRCFGGVPPDPDCVLRREVCAPGGANPMRDGTIAVTVVT